MRRIVVVLAAVAAGLGLARGLAGRRRRAPPGAAPGRPPRSAARPSVEPSEQPIMGDGQLGGALLPGADQANPEGSHFLDRPDGARPPRG